MPRSARPVGFSPDLTSTPASLRRLPVAGVSSLRHRATLFGRCAAALAVGSLLLTGCGQGGDPAPEEEISQTGASDEGGADSSAGDGSDGASDSGGEPSDGGGATAAAVPVDPYPVTPAPDDFEAPGACTGEGAHLAEVGSGGAEPGLPERAGESLTIEVTAIEGDHAQLTAAIGSADPRPIEDITVGESVTIDLWTISLTSVCGDLDQVEFDLIN